MRKLRLFGTPVFAVIWVLALVSVAIADDDGRARFRTALTGYQETPATSTTGAGTFVVELDGDTISYTLTYGGLEGIAPAVTNGVVTAAHIHFGQKGVAGGVSAFLCGGSTKPTPCPLSGTVSGTITAADIIGPAVQGIEAMSFAEVVRALRAGLVYANVHTTRWPGGEIRGQVNERGRAQDNGRNDDGDDD